MKKKVISWGAVGAMFPVYPTIIFWLLFKQWTQPAWFWGMFWTLIAFWWLYAIYRMGKQQVCTPIFREDLKPGCHVLLFPEDPK